MGWSGARCRPSAWAMAAALAVLSPVAGSSVAVAQQASTPIDSRAELRPLSANSMDIAAGKQLAQRFCADCHGAAGISSIGNVPNLAGQRAAYLYREMRAYLMGARGNDTMNGAITYLSADAVSNVAAYYATLAPAQPAVSSDSMGEVDPIQAGKMAAAVCAGCHGEGGVSTTPGMPSLVGQEQKYMVAAMTAYKTGERKNDAMKAMLATTTDASLDNIALFYAMQKAARAKGPAAGDPAAGHTLAAPAPLAMAPKGSAAIPPRPVWPARMPST